MSLYTEYSDQFPMLQTQMNGKRLVYLDTAATSLKPRSVIESVKNYYSNITCNVHRSIHTLGEESTIAYEQTRDSVKELINAEKREEIIFTKGTTDGLNLLARTLGDYLLSENDELLLTVLEHHSNIVPWQLCSERTKAKIKVLDINDNGELLIDRLGDLISEKTKIFSLTGVSNTLGTINPIKEIIKRAKKLNPDIKIIIDAAQMIAHEQIDVQSLDCDFLVFSAHKIFGPTGVGVLYGKENILEEMPPFQGGGDMIDIVTFEKTTYNNLPYKFEAGTPAIASVIGLHEAVKFLMKVGVKNIATYTHKLTRKLDNALNDISGLQLLSRAKEKSSIATFNIDGIHNQDLASLISMDGVAIRTGHHCTQPLLQRLGVNSTARASLSIYNNEEDIDIFVSALKKAKDLLS